MGYSTVEIWPGFVQRLAQEGPGPCLGLPGTPVVNGAGREVESEGIQGGLSFTSLVVLKGCRAAGADNFNAPGKVRARIRSPWASNIKLHSIWTGQIPPVPSLSTYQALSLGIAVPPSRPAPVQKHFVPGVRPCLGQTCS